MTTTIPALLVLLAAQAVGDETPKETPTTTEAPQTETKTEDPPPASPPAAPTYLEDAEAKLASGDALEVTAHLTRAIKEGKVDESEKERVVNLLARAADALADSGDIKAAAVAADASWQLEGRPHRPRAALLMAHYAASIVENDGPGARAIAERALLADPENAQAKELASSLAGSDTWRVGHYTLGGGLALAIVSSASFVYGFDVERQIRGQAHQTAEVDALLLRRGAAAGIAWPTAAFAVVGTGLGLALIMSHEPGAPAVLPAPFHPLPVEQPPTTAAMATTKTTKKEQQQ